MAVQLTQRVQTTTILRGGFSGTLTLGTTVGMCQNAILDVTYGDQRWRVRVLDTPGDGITLTGRLVDDRLTPRAQMDLSLIPAGADVLMAPQLIDPNRPEPPPPITNGPKVVAVYLVTIDISPPDNTWTGLGLNLQYAATGNYSDGSTADLTNIVTWASSDPTVATIDSTGLLTTVDFGAGLGHAAISATLGLVVGTTNVYVNAVVAIVVTPANPVIGVDVVQQMTATFHLSDGGITFGTQSATWSSSDAGTVSISNDLGTEGQATGVSPGGATLSADYAGVHGDTIATVPAPMLFDDVDPNIVTHFWVNGGVFLDTKSQPWVETGTVPKHAAAPTGFPCGKSAESMGPSDASNFIGHYTPGYSVPNFAWIYLDWTWSFVVSLTDVGGGEFYVFSDGLPWSHGISVRYGPDYAGGTLKDVSVRLLYNSASIESATYTISAHEPFAFSVGRSNSGKGGFYPGYPGVTGGDIWFKFNGYGTEFGQDFGAFMPWVAGAACIGGTYNYANNPLNGFQSPFPGRIFEGRLTTTTPSLYYLNTLHNELGPWPV